MAKKNTVKADHILTETSAVTLVNRMTETITDAHFSDSQLLSRKMKSIPGSQHEKLKVANRYVQKEFNIQKKEAKLGYSKERTAELLGNALNSLEKAKHTTNGAGVAIGKGLRTLCRPFESIKTGFVQG